MRAGAAKPRDARNEGGSPSLVTFRASPVSRHQSRAWPLRVSRFARRTTEKKETARSLRKCTLIPVCGAGWRMSLTGRNPKRNELPKELGRMFILYVRYDIWTIRSCFVHSFLTGAKISFVIPKVSSIYRPGETGY